MSRRYISQQAAAEQLGVTVQTVRNYVATGRLTAYRIGPSRLRVDESELANVRRVVPAARPVWSPSASAKVVAAEQLEVVAAAIAAEADLQSRVRPPR